jgi:hypothetical protein
VLFRGEKRAIAAAPLPVLAASTRDVDITTITVGQGIRASGGAKSMT